MKVTRKASLAAAAALMLTLTACAESERDGNGGEGEGGGGTLTFAAAGAPEMFDPVYATDGETFRVTRQIFEGLVGLEPGGADLVPELATEWTPNEDGTVWTFTLEEGVKFQDGTPFNAEAVCTNLDRMYNQNKDGEVAAEYWSFTMGFGAESLYKGCEASDDVTAVITIDHATDSFPAMLALPSFAMQSPKAIEEGDANGIKAQGEGFVFPSYAQNPVGTGPFTFESYDEANQTVTLVRNDDYWGDKAISDKLVFRIIPEESTRRQELEAGSINGYDLPNPVDWKGLEDEGNQVEIRDAFNVLYMGLNPVNNPLLKKPEVRQALYYALNRDQLVQTQLPEGASVATQFMPDTVAGYNDSIAPYAYDPDKAKQMLADAGAADLTLTFAYPTDVTRPYMPDPLQIYEALRADLEAVGVTVKVERASWNGGYLDNVDAGKYDAYLLGWTGDYNAASNFIGSFFGVVENNAFGLDQYPWGETLAKGINDASAIVDEAERTAAYEALNEQIMTEYLPGLPISHSPPAIVVGPDVTGLVPSPLTAEEFAPVSVGGQ